MKSIKEIKNLSGKRVLVRVAFNVPVKDGKVIDDFRIKKSLKTIKYLQSKNAKIILISHLGEDEKESFKPIISKFKKYIPKLVFLDKPIFSDETEDAIKNLKKGDIVLLENLRKEKGEKDNSPSFARALSRYGDIYINDDFPVSHRAHASIVGITKYLPGYAGFQFEEEVKNLSTAFSCYTIQNTNWILGGPKENKKYKAQIRYHGEYLSCKVKIIDKDEAYVFFDKLPLTSKGQSIVIYDGDVCIGGGVVVVTVMSA
jgi:3-phosphoglycerate kinase